MEPKIKYEKIIDIINQAQRPIVFVNGLAHGDEKVGKFVIDHLNNLEIKAGTLLTNIANEKAFEKGVRFIEKDLNRIAPGDINGDYEEQVAFYLSQIAKTVDIFIDIHSTESSLRNSIIVHELSAETKKFIEVINPETVLIMKVTGDKVLLAKAKIGIAFEYGNDNDPIATDSVVRDIKKVLSYLEMIDEEFLHSDNKTRIFSVEKMFKKEVGDVLSPAISNLELVKKGDCVSISKSGDVIRAERDFFPVLFSQNGYEEIFGFEGVEIDNIPICVIIVNEA